MPIYILPPLCAIVPGTAYVIFYFFLLANLAEKFGVRVSRRSSSQLDTSRKVSNFCQSFIFPTGISKLPKRKHEFLLRVSEANEVPISSHI